MDTNDIGALDIDELTPAQLRKVIRRLMAKGLDKGEDSDKEVEKSEEEREKLSKLREESNGKGPSPKVEKDDLPEELRESDEDEDEGKSKKKEG